jgi:hypothetical protein
LPSILKARHVLDPPMLAKATASMRKSLVAVPALFCLLGMPTQAADAVHFTTLHDIAARIATAHNVTISVSTLSPRDDITHALLADAASKGHVHVILDGRASGTARRTSHATEAKLRRAGVSVEYAQKPILQAMLIDGAAFLTDRDEHSGAHTDIMLEDDIPADRSVIAHAVAGISTSNNHLQTRKSTALAAEANVLNGNASHDVSVESVSLDDAPSIFNALLTRREHGDRVRVILAKQTRKKHSSSEEEQATVDRLTSAGIKVRVSTTAENLALDGARGWIGSADAIPALSDHIDWGMTTNGEMSAFLRKRFEEHWDTAKPPGSENHKSHGRHGSRHRF